MAVYKIFPIKDNFISDEKPTSNFGRDEILELSSGDNISRILMEFNQDDITNVINNISGSFQANLKLYYSNAVNLNETFTTEIQPLSQSWIMGTGRSGDVPNPQNGSNWNSPDLSGSWDYWNSLSNIYKYSQSFSFYDNKDINCEITNIVDGWNNNDIENNGLLIKYTLEEEASSSYSTKYFSVDTHTIYPPHIEVYWNDIIYSSSLPIISSSIFDSTITNLKKEYIEGEKHTFIIKNRDVHPIRSFQTSSLYLNTKILPENSWWSLKDVKTEEIIIDYHNIGTKIGANNIGNYFNIDFNGLQPERYYQLLIKTIINGETIIINNKNNYFKLIR